MKACLKYSTSSSYDEFTSNYGIGRTDDHPNGVGAHRTTFERKSVAVHKKGQMGR